MVLASVLLLDSLRDLWKDSAHTALQLAGRRKETPHGPPGNRAAAIRGTAAGIPCHRPAIADVGEPRRRGDRLRPISRGLYRPGHAPVSSVRSLRAGLRP